MSPDKCPTSYISVYICKRSFDTHQFLSSEVIRHCSRPWKERPSSVRFLCFTTYSHLCWTHNIVLYSFLNISHHKFYQDSVYGQTSTYAQPWNRNGHSTCADWLFGLNVCQILCKSECISETLQLFFLYISFHDSWAYLKLPSPTLHKQILWFRERQFE